MTIIRHTYQSRLLERFEKMDMSLKEVSKQSGVSYDILRTIKSKEPVNYRIETLRKLCKALNLDLSISIKDNNYYERTTEDEDNYDEIEYHDWEEDYEWEYRD